MSETTNTTSTETSTTSDMESSEGPILALVVALLVGLLVRSIGSLMPQKLQAIPLPYTATILILGTAIGLIVQNCPPVPYVTDSLKSLEEISPSALFTIFLPALMMPAGLHLQWHVVKRVIDKALLLAIPGTLVNTGLTALVARYIFPYNWAWSTCFLFGGTLAATDPVATVAIIKTLGISAKLATIIDGEALLNDGVAFVIFTIFRQWAVGAPMTAGSVIAFLVKSSIGGPALALAWAFVMIIWLLTSFNDGIFEVSLSVVAAYSLWIVTDQVIEASGLLALAVFSTALGAYGMSRVSRSETHAFEFFWDWVDWIANTLIFFLSGLIAAVELSSLNTIKPADWGWAVVLWVMLTLIRIGMTIMFFPLLRLGAYGIDWRDAIVVAWSGLRGAVGLTLALMVYYSKDLGDESYRQHFIFFTAFIAVITLLVQGSSTSLLLKGLGFTALPEAKRASMIGAARAVERMGQVQVQKTRRKFHLLGEGDWSRVEAMTQLGIVDDIVKRQPVEGAGGKRNKLSELLTRMNSRQGVEVGKEAVVDLRQRLLQGALSMCNDAFSKDYLTPDEFEILQSVIDHELDVVHKGALSDWSRLERQLTPLDHLIRAPTWPERLLPWKWRDTKVRRDAALCSVYAYAHAEARKDLETFMHIQVLHHHSSAASGADESVSVGGEGGSVHGGGGLHRLSGSVHGVGWRGTSPRKRTMMSMGGGGRGGRGDATDNHHPRG